MSMGWGGLPLLPLRCILEHLSLEDALAAMSTCRHWRSGLLMYEGRRNTLKLQAKQLDKSSFLARIFKKHVRVLHLDIGDCSHEELNQFMNRVMPQFFDTLELREVFIMGPGCVQQTAHANVKLDRIITESLVFKHSHSIQKFALMNCEMDIVHPKTKDKDVHDNVEYYSRGLRFDTPSSADAVLSRHNAQAMMFSSLQHIITDYDLITTETLETLSNLTSFCQLGAILCNKKRSLHTVDWRRVMACYPNGLDVAVNLISLPLRKMDEVMKHVLVEDMPLTSLKVMFCKTFYSVLLKHCVCLHRATLRELVWADPPHATYGRPTPADVLYDICNINPVILVCWQCTQLQRLVIHGYSMWQYDVLGCVRLRKSLRHLELSGVCGRVPHASLARLWGRTPDCTDTGFIAQVNEYTEFKWQPTPWSQLHPALRTRASPEQRAAYIVQEVTHPLMSGVQN